MNNDLIIRKAEYFDLEYVFTAICELENEQMDFDSFKTIYEKNIVNPEYAYFIATYKNNAIGFISFHTQNLLHHSGRVGEIQELYINKDFRNKGIGKMLVSEIEKFALTNHLKSIEVTSNKVRAENVKIYEHYGFKLSHHKFTKI